MSREAPPLMAGEPAELRLLIPAALAWLSAAIAMSMSVGVGLVLAVVLVVAGLAGAVAVRRRREQLRRRGRVVTAALVCAAGAAAAAAWRVGAVQRGPLPQLARAHASVTLVLVVTSDPHLSQAAAPTFGRPLVVLSARAVEVTTTDGSVSISSPIVVLTTASGWLSLQPSQRVTAVGRVSVPQPGELEAAVFDARGSPSAIGAPSFVQRIAGHVRTGLRRAAAPLPRGPGGLLPGLVDGDTSALPPDLVKDFRTTGLTHIVAVSGANVAIVLGAALVVARWAGAGLRTQALIGVLTIVGFVIVARPQASVLRAAAMGLVAVLALATGRRRRALPALCAAVLCLIFIDPTLSLSVGFALSVAATASLLVLAPRLRTRMARRVPGWLADALAVPTAATLACAPLIALISGQVSLASIPANLLAEPAVAPATILGVVTAGLAQISMPIAQGIARAGGVPCAWLVLVARTFARLPGAAVRWPSGSAGAFELLGLMAAAVVVAVVLKCRRTAHGWPRIGVRLGAFGIAGAVAMVSCAIASRSAAPRWPQTGWVMAACDVGQGAAIVVRAGPAAAVLVDAGPAPVAVDRCLIALGVHELSSIVLTGGSAAAVGGVPGALHARTVGTVDIGSSLAPDAAARIGGWTAAVHVALVTDGSSEAHTVGGLRWQVLAEFETSRVVELAVPGLRLLAAGDIDASDQTELAAQRVQLNADVFVVPRHGADTLATEFLQAVRPEVAIVSVGRGNSQRDPSAKALQLLATAGARVVRTDRDGDVAISVEPGGLRVVTRHASFAVHATVATGTSAAGCMVGAPPLADMACCPSCLLNRSPRSRLWSAKKSSSSNARSPP